MPKEKTSKRIAKDASFVLANADLFIARLKRRQREMSEEILAWEQAKSAAASALTQVEEGNA